MRRGVDDLSGAMHKLNKGSAEKRAKDGEADIQGAGGRIKVDAADADCPASDGTDGRGGVFGARATVRGAFGDAASGADCAGGIGGTGRATGFGSSEGNPHQPRSNL